MLLTSHEMTVAADSFDIYIVMRPFSKRSREHRQALAVLQDVERRLALGAEGYYSPSLDTALLAIRFDRSLAARLGFDRLRSLVAGAGLPTITPDEMPFERRCEFFIDHLATYTTYVQRYRDSRNETVIGRVADSLADHVLDGVVQPRIEPKVSTKFCARPQRPRFATPAPV